jgi:tetratricopeptide (TPR) repeat protein
MNSETQRRQPLVAIAVTVLLAIIALQLTIMARVNSCTWDEADHTYAGYMQWKHGDFGLNAEHPPLVKFLAALPLLKMDLKMPPLQDRPYRLQEAAGGRDFVFQNDANTILFRARMATLPVALLLALFVFLTGQEMFGTGAGLIALSLISFDPTLLANSALVTTDAGQAFFMLWAIYAFYRYVNVPSTWRLVTAGSAVGLALASKHSAVLLFPMLLLLALFEVLSRRKQSASIVIGSLRRHVLRLGLALITISAMSLCILWAFYGFRYRARVESLPLNPTMAAQLHRVPSAFEGRALGFIDKLHLLPESYTYGFAHVLFQSKAFASYLLGMIYPHPVWFFFPIAMPIKATLTFLILFGIAIWAVATDRFRALRELLYMGIPALVYMVFAMAGGMNIGVRHVLPVYIFLSIASAGAAWKLIQRDRRWLYTVIVLVVFQAGSVLHAFPAYASYANEAAGGPSNVHNLLSDSSADWGQQLKSVKAYLDANGMKDCWFAYFAQGVADYSYYGIPCKPLITADSLYFDGPRDVPTSIDGPVLMSASVLSGYEFGPDSLNPYLEFKGLKPVAAIDYGVFVFQGHFNIPLASALSHVQKAGLLQQQKAASNALAEAQKAMELAPESATVNLTMGRALDANGRAREAVPYYQRALAIARSIEPTFQSSIVAAATLRLATQRP